VLDAGLQRRPARQAPPHPIQVGPPLLDGSIAGEHASEPVDQVLEVAAQQEEGEQVRVGVDATVGGALVAGQERREPSAGEQD
jgi:hypothetical protein